MMTKQQSHASFEEVHHTLSTHTKHIMCMRGQLYSLLNALLVFRRSRISLFFTLIILITMITLKTLETLKTLQPVLTYLLMYPLPSFTSEQSEKTSKMERENRQLTATNARMKVFFFLICQHSYLYYPHHFCYPHQSN